ncbi:MAG: hypothetical protein M0Z33_11925 [Actinomycetota bacterium]|nr:hypothetical protein [Actinomycetota bacterium]
MARSEDVDEVTGEPGVAAAPPPVAPAAPRTGWRVEARVGAPSTGPSAGVEATITAEIPVVSGGRHRRPARGSDEWYASRRRSAPYAVRLVVWLLFFVLLVALAGRAVEHYHPAWLDFLRNTTRTSSGTASTGGEKGHRTASRPSSSTLAPTGFRLLSSGAHGATYSVPSPRYSVVVTTSTPSWTEVATPAGSTTYRYAETVLPGASPKAFAVTGSSTVVLAHTVTSIGVEIGGRTVGTISTPRVGYPYSFRPAAS